MNLSDVLTATPKKRLEPPPNDRLISPHKLKLRRVDEPGRDAVEQLLQVGLLRAGDVLACGSCRARLLQDGKVREEDTGTTHENAEAFAQCQPESDQPEEEPWKERVFAMNVGLTGFSTRLGVSVAELARVAAAHES